MSVRRTGPLRAAFALSLAADRRATIITQINFALRPAALVVTAWLVATVLNAAAAGDRHRALAAAVAAAVVAALNAGSAPLAVEISARMIEATSAAVDEQLMTLVGGLQSVELLEDPELLDQLEVLHQERVYLAEGADALSLILGVGVRALLTAVFLALVSPWLLLTPLLAVPSVVASRRGQQRREAALKAGAGQARLADHLYRAASAPAAAEEVRVFGVTGPLRRRRDRVQGEADAVVVGAVFRSLTATLLGAMVFAAGFVASLIVVVHEYSSGGAGIGDIVLTLTLVISLNQQILTAIAFFGFLQQTRSSSARLIALRSLCAADAERWTGDEAPPRRLTEGIRVDDLTFRYAGADHDALHDLSLTLPAGAVVAVVGGNGAGKSTLIKLLCGLYQPTSGSILVDGVSLGRFQPARWRSAVSACFQDFGRLEFTLRESVGLGGPENVEDGAVLEAMTQGAALELVDRLPGGLDTPLGRSFDEGTELSGGEWQRIALARARMRLAPLLLVLDEPAAAIDPLAEQQLLQRYVAAARETSRSANGITLFASHRLSTARLADLVVVVADGAVAEIGTHTELMNLPDGHYRRLFLTQARSYGLVDDRL